MPPPSSVPSDGSSRAQPAHSGPAKRGIRISHLMLLVAATAFGIAGIRNVDALMPALQLARLNLPFLIGHTSPLLIFLSLGVLAATLLRPRLRLSEAFRQPGFVANWTASLFMGFFVLKIYLKHPHIPVDFEPIHKLFSYSYLSSCGSGVIVAWMTLAFAGSWRAEPSWIDRVGRALGVLYIAVFLANNFP